MKRILSVGAVAAVIALSACGGSKSDSTKINDLVKKVSDNPTAFCDNATANLLKQVGGKAACQQQVKAQSDSAPTSVSNLKINGGTATGTVKDKKGGTSQTGFKKEGGDWKFDSVS